MDEKYKKLFHKALEDIEYLKMKEDGNEVRLMQHTNHLRGIAKYAKANNQLWFGIAVGILIIIAIVK